MNEKYVISDVHGCFNTLLLLLQKLPDGVKEEDVIFVGDLIDRGPDSRKVIEFVKNGNYQCLLGNHEDLMIRAWDDYKEYKVPLENNGIWIQNGGDICLDNYMNDGIIDYNILEKDIQWLKTLPTHILCNIVDEKNRKLVVTHATVVDALDRYLDLDENDYDEVELEHIKYSFEEAKIWNRTIPKYGSEKYFNISGHNITEIFINKFPNKSLNEDSLIIDKGMGYAYIDTGVFLRNKKYENAGKITCLSFPSFRVYQQENIERIENAN
jgi:serine/threonine protein phosphatase 1